MLRLALAGLVLTTTALAQEPPVDSKPAAPVLMRVTGTVVGEGGLPIAGAVVQLPFSSTSSPTTLSDSQGVFTLPGVRAGTHTLLVDKPGFFQVNRGRESGARQVTVRPGQDVQGITVTLVKGGVISGRIVDDLGQPLDQLQVSALRWGRAMDGSRALVPAGAIDLSDDHGQFRLFGLAPGDYAVMAVRPDPRPEGFDAMALGSPAGPSHLPIYFPGTRFQSEARFVTIDPGREEVVNFSWEPVRAVRVSGGVVSPTPLTMAEVFLSSPAMSSAGARLGAGGTFAFENVAPGDYLVTVRSRDTAGGAFTSLPVTVRDEDVSGLVVTMRSPATIKGRVTFEGGAPASPASAALRMLSNDAGDLMSYVLGDPVRLEDDGSFETQSGRSRVFFDVGDGWSVAGVTVNGDDALLTGIDLSSGSAVENVRVHLTRRPARVSGRVMSDRGEPVDGIRVTVYQIDAPQAPLRMTLRTVQSDGDGRFEMSGLRRGSYVAVATEAGDNAPADPDFQDWLRSVGQRFSLGEGQAVTLTLQPVTR